MDNSAKHIPTLRRLRDRLSDLSMRNRSLRLIRLPKKRAFDLAWLDAVHPGDSARVLERVISGRKQAAVLLSVGTDDEDAQAIHRGLTYLDREVRLVEDERGVYDLSIGLLFLCGSIAEGKYIQAPLFLIPRRLVLDRKRRDGTRWTVDAMGDPKEIHVNRTLLLALQKYADLTLDLESLEESAAELVFGTRRRDGWLTELTQRTADLLRSHGLRPSPTLGAWGSEPAGSSVPGSELVPALPLYTAIEVPSPPVRRFELRPHAVMSRFPLADTALLSDYDDLVRVLEVNPKQPLGYAGALLGDPAPLPAHHQRPLTFGTKASRWHIESTDESQEAVLTRVLDGQSMAVYGPPGTGKSQLIANLVASILAEGKRVLVVSQKRPALDVVAQRLGPDLERFVALVHDPIRDRQALCDRIITTMAPALMQSGTANVAERLRLLGQIEQDEQFFDQVHKSLTSTSEIGVTPFEAYLYRLRFPGKPMALKVHKLPPVSPSALINAVPSLQQYVVDREWARTPGSWRHRRPDFGSRAIDELERFTDEQLSTIVSALSDYLEWDTARPGDVEELASAVGNSSAYQSLLTWCQRAESLSSSSWSWLPVVGKLPGPSEAIQSDVRTMENLLLHRSRTQGVMLVSEMASSEVERLFGEFEAASVLWYRFILPAWYQCQDKVRAALSDEGIDTADLVAGIDTWRMRAAYTAELRTTQSKLNVFGLANLDLTVFTPGTLESLQAATLAAAEAVMAWRRDVAGRTRHLVDEMPTSLKRAKQLIARAEYALRAPRLLQQLEASERVLGEWVGPDARDWLVQAHKQRDPASISTRFTTEVVANFEALSGADRRLADTMNRFPELEPLAVEARNGGVSDIEDELWTAFSERWVRNARETHSVLGGVEHRDVEFRRKNLAKAWGDLPGVNRTVLQAKLHDAAAGIKQSYQGELLKRAEQKRRRWPVRKLVELLWTRGLADLLPVWLCSPETVAAVFPLTPNFFDYVVFDEASQCTLPQGLTAVYRGRTCVIAGDEQQLPPSNLFSTTLEDEDDLDEVIDEESLLSRAKSAGVDMSLMWHYRSRYPELIQFSNDAFYNGGLRVSPLPVSRFSPPALEWIHVPGEWTRRANEAEGSLAVELIERYLKDHPDQSIGVITVNRQQSDHIHDLLDQRLQASPTLQKRYEEAMARALDERPFIRNLENVQGDERDVVILSVAYSADASGRVPLRFGALSMPGGERRLNVAISRARRKMIVLCSFDPETQLQVGEQTSKGAQILRDFLCYARSVGGTQGDGKARSASHKAPVHHEHAVATNYLAKVLHDWGWRVDQAVGASAARVDLAVRSKRDPGRYMLGILLDGPGASWATTSIGREVGRIEYLNRYMWPVQVVSIPALVRNKQAVLDAIRARLDSEEKRLDAVPSPPSVVIPRQPEATKTATAARPPASAAAGKSRLKRVVESAPQEGAAPTAPTDEPPKSQTPVVEPGSTVTYRDVELDRVREVVLVGPTVPRGIDAVRLHVPLAQALMGARVGQVVPLELASGTRELEILAIKAPRPMDR